MKVAGRVTGGLHQRPEYNVALSEPTLDLAQLPTEVWPNGELPADLASRVQPLFSTDFYREKWLVAVDGSQIEIALDQGEVKAGEFAEPICELELELLSGDTRAVLKLANQLVSQTGLRQGSLSKAARGYHLAQGNPAREIKPTTILHVAAKADVEQGLEAALERGVLFDVLAVFVERCRADDLNFAARERGLEDIGGVHRALGVARADEVMHLIDEEDDVAVLLNLLHHLLDTLLKFAPVLGAGHHAGKVQRQELLIQQVLRHIAHGDLPGQALGDGSLAHAGLTDQAGVVLGLTGQDADDVPDLLIAADDGVQLLLAGQIDQILTVLLEGIVGVLGVIVGHALVAADGSELL